MSEDKYIWKRIKNEDLIYEHINERYALMSENSNKIKQDLGIINDKEEKVIIEIDYITTGKNLTGTKKKLKQTASNYRIELNQSLTSLKSNTNGNSTTGFVVWQSTYFFITWLLNHDGLKFLNWESKNINIMELGSGINCSNSIILSNYCKDFFILTDQKGILNKLQENCRNNLKEIKNYNQSEKFLTETRIKEANFLGSKHPLFCSKSLNINDFLTNNLDSDLFHYEVGILDWCDNTTYQEFIYNYGSIISGTNSNMTILAVDVIYNEFLIVPFLKTIKDILTYKKNADALVVLQLRDESIIIDFLTETLEIGFNLETVEDVEDELVIGCSRHVIYRLSLNPTS
ncbi:hypothetical protein ACO0OE_002717 [Hanseniaspora uvarum]